MPFAELFQHIAHARIDAAVLALATVAIYGIWHRHLKRQQIATPRASLTFAGVLGLVLGALLFAVYVRRSASLTRHSRDTSDESF